MATINPFSAFKVPGNAGKDIVPTINTCFRTITCIPNVTKAKEIAKQ